MSRLSSQLCYFTGVFFKILFLFGSLMPKLPQKKNQQLKCQRLEKMFFTNGTGCHTCHLFTISFSINFLWKTCGPSELQVIIVMPPACVKKVATFVQNPANKISSPGQGSEGITLKFTMKISKVRALPGFSQRFPVSQSQLCRVKDTASVSWPGSCPPFEA